MTRALRHAPILLLPLLILTGCQKEDQPVLPVIPGNHAPTITSLTSSASEIMAGHTVDLACNATDEDGDSLEYSWLASDGSFLEGQTDSATTWTPPFIATTATIWVNVSDGDLVVKDSVMVTVTGIDPRIPRDPTPYDGENDISPLAELGWGIGDGVTETVHFDIYLGAGQDLALTASDVTEMNYTVEFPLQPGVDYRWRVAAVTTDGETIVGETWHFTVQSLSLAPPLGDVAFLNFRSLLGTVDSQNLGVTYLRRVGAESFVHQPSQVVVWNPSYSSSTEPALAVYDLETETLYLVDENGQGIRQWESAYVYTYGFSGSGSRLAHVVQDGPDQQHLIGDGVPPIVSHDEYGSLNAPWVYSSRPSFSTGGTNLAIAAVNGDVPTVGRLIVAKRNNDVVYTYDHLVWSPQFGPQGDHTAWLEANTGSTHANNLVIGESTFSEQGRYSLDDYQAGCTELAWSPDGLYVALFAGLNTCAPQLLVYSVSDHTLSEVPLPQTGVALPTEEREHIRPAWSADSQEIAFCTPIAEGYALVATTISGQTRVLASGLSAPVGIDWQHPN